MRHLLSLLYARTASLVFPSDLFCLEERRNKMCFTRQPMSDEIFNSHIYVQGKVILNAFIRVLSRCICLLNVKCHVELIWEVAANELHRVCVKAFLSNVFLHSMGGQGLISPIS
jgi:hypothetical protein